jgi:hypothetical protein
MFLFLFEKQGLYPSHFSARLYALVFAGTIVVEMLTSIGKKLPLRSGLDG